jgi:hypothetical protein
MPRLSRRAGPMLVTLRGCTADDAALRPRPHARADVRLLAGHVAQSAAGAGRDQDTAPRGAGAVVSYARYVVGVRGRQRVGSQHAVPGLRYWSAAVIVTVLASFLLGLAIKLWYDEAYLEAHGVVTTAVIDDFHTTRYGTTVWLHFTGPDGAKIDAIVHDPPDTVRLEAGGTLPVRYDSGDPTGRIKPVGADDATFVRWLLLSFSTLLLTMIGRAVVRRLRGSRPAAET